MFVFSLDELAVLFTSGRRDTLKKYLSRWQKKQWVSRLRQGLYELTFQGEPSLPDMYLANRIYGPSYVSLETVLSDHGLVPEVSMAVTSITSKPTRRFKNRHGLFWYRSVRPKAFSGYRIERRSGVDVYVAEPEKALLDYLYFKTRRDGGWDPKSHRFDLRRIKRLDRKKLARYAKLYGVDLWSVLHVDL